MTHFALVKQHGVSLLTLILLKSGSLFCLNGSNRDFDLPSSLSVTNSRYWFCPTLSNVLTVSTTECKK